MSRLRISLAITFLSTNGATVVLFLVTLALSRLLSPADVGIFSITAVLVGIAQVFRDFGVSSYLLQEKDLTPAKIRSASGVLIAASWTLGAAMFLASGAAARYFQQPGVEQVMQVLATGFFFIPFGAITHVLLTREMRAREQAIVTVAGTAAYALSALVLAYKGFGYMSMAWANLINIVVTGLAYSFYRPRNAPWMPSFSGWGRVSHFGAGSIIAGCVGQINVALPDLVLGKLSGPHDVGIFSRSHATAWIFMQVAGPAVNYAAVPYLATLHHKGESLHLTLAKAVSYLTVCGWVPLLLTAMFAEEVILLLYGSTWIECARVVPWLCGITAIGMAFNFHGAGLLAVGRPFWAVIPNLIYLLVRLGAVFAVFDGTLISFTYGLVLASIVTIPVGICIQRRFFGMDIRHFLAALLPSGMITLACGAVALLIRFAVPIAWPIPAKAVLVVVCTGVVWLFTLVLLRHPFVAEIERIGVRYPLAKWLLRMARCGRRA